MMVVSDSAVPRLLVPLQEYTPASESLTEGSKRTPSGKDMALALSNTCTTWGGEGGVVRGGEGRGMGGKRGGRGGE